MLTCSRVHVASSWGVKLFSLFRVSSDGTETFLCKKASLNSARSWLKTNEIFLRAGEGCWWFVVQGERDVPKPNVVTCFGPSFLPGDDEEALTRWFYSQLSLKFPHMPALYR